MTSALLIAALAVAGACDVASNVGVAVDAGADAGPDSLSGVKGPPTGGGPDRTGGEPTSAERRPEGPDWADEVVDAPGHTGEGLFDAGKCVNGVRGGVSAAQGSADTFSLGYGDDDSYVVVRWSGRLIVDAPGPDLVVFENPFLIGGGPRRFMDHVIVEVSRDGATWVAFPHDFTAEDEARYSNDPAHWPGFAGVTPVRLHEEANPVDPFDAEAAGGDAFDLADLPAGDDEAAAIRDEGARFVRVTTAPSRLNPDTGAPYPRDLASNGADIDGIYARALRDDVSDDTP